MKRIILFITISLFTVSVMAQNQQDAAAQQGLANFKQLIKAQPSKSNDSLISDIENLSLGKSISTAIIPLDRLRKYSGGQPANDLIVNINQIVYPVINNRTKRTVSTISIENNKDKWAPAAYGADKRIAEKISTYTSDAGNHKLVKIIALNLSFISVENGNALQFIPLQDDRERDIIQGRPVAAEKILETYFKAANDYNGLPL